MGLLTNHHMVALSNQSSRDWTAKSVSIKYRHSRVNLAGRPIRSVVTPVRSSFLPVRTMRSHDVPYSIEIDSEHRRFAFRLYGRDRRPEGRNATLDDHTASFAASTC